MYFYSTHTDNKPNGANVHRRVVLGLDLLLRVAPHVGQFQATLLQGHRASLEVRLLVQQPAGTSTNMCLFVLYENMKLREKLM